MFHRIKTITRSGQRCTIDRDNETREFRVRVNDSHGSDYFTDNRADAFTRAAEMIEDSAQRFESIRGQWQ